MFQHHHTDCFVSHAQETNPATIDFVKMFKSLADTYYKNLNGVLLFISDFLSLVKEGMHSFSEPN